MDVKAELDKLKIRSDGSTAKYYELPYGARELQDLISHKDMNYFIGLIFSMCYTYSTTNRNDLLLLEDMLRLINYEIGRLESL